MWPEHKTPSDFNLRLFTTTVTPWHKPYTLVKVQFFLLMFVKSRVWFTHSYSSRNNRVSEQSTWQTCKVKLWTWSALTFTIFNIICHRFTSVFSTAGTQKFHLRAPRNKRPHPIWQKEKKRRKRRTHGVHFFTDLDSISPSLEDNAEQTEDPLTAAPTTDCFTSFGSLGIQSFGWRGE